MPPDKPARKSKTPNVSALTLQEIHESVGHLAKSTLKRMVKNGCVLGVELLPPEQDPTYSDPCLTCVEANLKKADIPKMAPRILTRPLQLVGSDIQTIETRSHDGKKYFSV